MVVRGLRKVYEGDRGAPRPQPALDGVDLVVRPGEVVAILGPNGAGKTSLVEILEGYRTPTAGDVRVLGSSPVHGGPAWRDRIGVVLQQSGALPDLTVAETLAMYRAYYTRPRPVAELIELGGLAKVRNVRVRRLSGGQRRRLDLALALAGSPDLLFLDEPTTGFDPEARREAWEVVRGMVREGSTVVLTTHYLDEADVLADRIVVITGGRIVVDGDHAALAAAIGNEARIRFRVPDDEHVDLASCPVTVVVERPWVEVRTPTPTATMHALTAWALDHGVELGDLTLARPTLEQLYLDLIGARGTTEYER